MTVRFALSTVAAVALMGIAACGDGRDDDVVQAPDAMTATEQTAEPVLDGVGEHVTALGLNREELEDADLLSADRTDLGMKVVVNHRYWGLIYQDDISQPLRRGQSLTGYVKQRREDGRVDISLLPPGAARLDVVGDQVLKALRESGGYLALGDKSTAHDIKARLGVSKSAYKQAIGRLYKQQLITLEPNAIRLVPGALSE